MVSIKALIDELGGGRSVALGAVLVVCVYVAADSWVESVEARFRDINERIRPLEAAQQRSEAFEHASTRFTGEQGTALESRISRLENWIDGGRYERRNYGQSREQ